MNWALMAPISSSCAGNSPIWNIVAKLTTHIPPQQIMWLLSISRDQTSPVAISPAFRCFFKAMYSRSAQAP